MEDDIDTRLRRAERLEQLLELGRVLTAELDREKVLERILETARRLTGARYAAVGILDERRRELAEFLVSGIDPAASEAIGHLPRGHGILGLLIDQPEPIRLHDVSEHPRSYGFPPGHPPMHGFLGAPIRIRGEAWGNLYLTEKEDGEDFDDDDVWSIVVLSEWAAIAVDNARLFSASEVRRSELERAVRGLAASTDIALALGGETELDHILVLIAKRARALVDADAMLILLADGDELRVVAHAGNADPPEDACLPLAGSTSGLALASGSTHRIDDVSTGLRVGPDRLGLPDAHSALIVPLTFRGRGLGVLMAFDRMDGEGMFAEDDERVLRSFAASAATAVATARSVEEQRLRDTVAAAEAERKRWARELHDETLQGLGALKLALSAARRSDPESMRATVEAAVDLLDQEISGLRGIITDLRPASLDELGLEPALRTLTARMAERHGLHIVAEVDLGDARIAHADETVAYRVTQEALNNVVKHADATAVSVVAVREGDELRLHVQDDGRGIDPARQGGGFGLLGMRERAALAGGRLDIAPGEDGQGTSVTLILPVADRDA